MLRGELTLLYAAPERVTTPRFLALLDTLHERGQARPVRDRRGALRQPVGPRLPAGVPGADGAARALSRRAAHRADRHGRRTHPRRHRRAPAAGGGAPVRQQLRPAQHPLHASSRRRTPTPQLLRFIEREHEGEAGIVYCQSRKRVEEIAEMLCERRHGRPALPRRAGRRGAAAPPGPLPARGRRGDGGHHRLRHGHRQARRALRRPPRHAQEHRGLLPGDRPRRPRRPAGRRLDGLRPAGRGEPAPHDRREPGRRGVQAGDARQARRAAGAGRGHRLPARAAARLLRRGLRSPAATATTA